MRYIFIFIPIFIILLSCQEKEKTSDKELHRYILVDKNGNPVPLPKDKLIVVNFLAYSCSSCMKEIPVLKKVIQEPQFKDKFQLIGIVIDSDKGDLSDPVFPIYPSHKQNFVRFPVPGTPTTYIITPEGKKLVVIYGAVTEKNFREFLKQALEKMKNYSNN
ncbi:plasmid transfer operon protein [Persephonella hydrogeniphila]|uniref:Plasmid transfer operon protein n=1 Tax=Persephonella hydrogeniphila TaxID=198703 RepID=A0A285NLS5_9AQUI|nr:TlpA disulfide reductase family protein [Persephonella hydrogeniphila]SNZ08591.1 plasmid transfer operon protein [Persephonella hydrogeniphila]